VSIGQTERAVVVSISKHCWGEERGRKERGREGERERGGKRTRERETERARERECARERASKREWGEECVCVREKESERKREGEREREREQGGTERESARAIKGERERARVYRIVAGPGRSCGVVDYFRLHYLGHYFHLWVCEYVCVSVCA
jgi:hypothetical protein